MVLLSKAVFPSLPLDVLIKVLSFLPGEHAARAACVCHDWFKTIDNCDDLWSNIFQTDFGPCHSKPEGVSWHQMYLNEWKWRNGRLMWETIRGHSVECIQLDERGLIVGSMGGPTVINPDDGSCRKFSQGQEVDMFVVTCFKAIGRWVVGGCSLSNEIRIWDADECKCTARLQGGSSGVLCLDFVGSPPKTIVSGSEDGSIGVWDVASGKCVQEMKGHQFMVSSIAFDGNFVVSGSVDRAIKIWPIEFGQCMETWEGHDGAITCLEFDGRCVITGSYDSTVRVWELASSECLLELRHPDEVSCLKAHGRWIITGCADRLIRLWEAETGRCIRTVQGPSKALSLDFDSRRIVGGFENNTLGIWTLADKAENIVTPDNLAIGGSKKGQCGSGGCATDNGQPTECVGTHRNTKSKLPRRADAAAPTTPARQGCAVDSRDAGITEGSLALHSIFMDATDDILEVGMLADPVPSIESQEDTVSRSDGGVLATAHIDSHGGDRSPRCNPPMETGNSTKIPKTGIPRYGSGKKFAVEAVKPAAGSDNDSSIIEEQPVGGMLEEFFEVDPLGRPNGDSIESAATCDDGASDTSADFLHDFDEDVAKAIENVFRSNPPSCELNTGHHQPQPQINRRCLSAGSTSRIPTPHTPSVLGDNNNHQPHNILARRWEALDRSKSTGSRIPVLREVVSPAAMPPGSRLPRRQRIHSVDSDKVFQRSLAGVCFGEHQPATEPAPTVASPMEGTAKKGATAAAADEGHLQGKDSDEVFDRSGHAEAVNKALDPAKDGGNHNTVVDANGERDGAGVAAATEKNWKWQQQSEKPQKHDGSSADEGSLDKVQLLSDAPERDQRYRHHHRQLHKCKEMGSEKRVLVSARVAPPPAAERPEAKNLVGVGARMVQEKEKSGKGGGGSGDHTERKENLINLDDISRIAKRTYEVISDPDIRVAAAAAAVTVANGRGSDLQEGSRIEAEAKESATQGRHRRKRKKNDGRKKPGSRSKERNSFFCLPSVLIRAAPFLFLGAWMLIKNCTNNRTP